MTPQTPDPNKPLPNDELISPIEPATEVDDDPDREVLEDLDARGDDEREGKL